jgi:acyl carrier protein
MDTRKELREFVFNNFLMARSDIELQDTDSLYDKGIIDSTGVLELVDFIEEKYGIHIADEELTPENLDSIDKICGYLERKRAS